jgi:hypothetical protein
MILTAIQDQAIAAHMALIVGGATFDRLFAGVRFAEVEGDILYVFAKDEATAAEMEDTFVLHISIIATGIPKARGGDSVSLAKKANSVRRALRSIELRCPDRIGLRLFQHLQRSIERITQMHCRRRATSQSPASDKPYINRVVCMGDQDSSAQFNLHNAAHDSVRGRDIEIDIGHVVAIVVGGTRSCWRINVGRFGHAAAPLFFTI